MLPHGASSETPCSMARRISPSLNRPREPAPVGADGQCPGPGLIQLANGLSDGLRRIDDQPVEPLSRPYAQLLLGDEHLAQQEVQQFPRLIDDGQLIDLALNHQLQRCAPRQRRQRQDRIAIGNLFAGRVQRRIAKQRAADVTVGQQAEKLPVRGRKGLVRPCRRDLGEPAHQ